MPTADSNLLLKRKVLRAKRVQTKRITTQDRDRLTPTLAWLCKHLEARIIFLKKAKEKFKPSTSRSSARKMSTWKVAKEAKITISSSNKFYCNRFKSNLVISQSRWGYKTRAAATLEATNWKMTEAVSPSQEVDNISRNCRWTKITNPNKPTLGIIL